MIMNVIRFRLENSRAILGSREITQVLNNIESYDGAALLMFSAAAYTLATKTQVLDLHETQMLDHRRESRTSSDVLARTVGHQLAQMCARAKQDFDLAHVSYLLGLRRLGELHDTSNSVLRTPPVC